MTVDATTAQRRLSSASIPDGWRRVRLGEIFEPVVDAGHTQDLPILSVTMHQGVVRRSSLDRRTDREVAREKHLRVKPGDIAYNTMRMWQGASGLVPEDGYLSPAYTVCRPLSSEWPEFWGHCFKAPAMVRAFREHSQGFAKDRYRLYYQHFATVPALQPPRAEQRRIAAILSSVDAAIEKSEAVIEQLQVVKKAMMQELLTRGLPGRHDRYCGTELGELPSEWSVAALSDLGSGGHSVVRTGPFGSSMKGEHFTRTGVPVLTIQSLGEGEVIDAGLFHVSREKAIELSEYEVVPGDLVFSRVADVGRSVVVPERGRGWLISSNLMRIRLAGDRADPRFIMQSIVGSPVIASQLLGIVSNAGRQIITSSVLGQLRFPLPHLAEQRTIADALEVIEEDARTEAALAERCRELKSALMSVLLTGELRVTADRDPDPDPAPAASTPDPT